MSKALDLENALPAIKAWITNLLALKAPLASPALTGNPTAPTQAASDDSTKIATTAYVKDVTPTKTSDLTNDSGFITIDDVPEGSAASTTTPLMDGTAAVGTETAFARGDHRHPTDTTRASVASVEALGNEITGLQDYIDTSLEGYLPLSGGTMTGPLTLNGAPTTNLHPATKKYVDDGLAGKAAAATTLSGYGITDAYTKSQVDSAVGAKADSATTLSGYGITDAYTKSQTDSAISTAISDLGTLYEYKGSVATYADLPASPSAGDVYNVVAAYGDYPAGTNWAWNGTAWDALGGAFSIEFATATEVTAVLNA